MRGVGELAELGRHEEGGLLTDIDGVVADPLEATRDGDLAHAPLERCGVVHVTQYLVEHLAVRAVDELVELVDAPRLRNVALGERVEGDTDHLDATLPHVDEALDDVPLRLEMAGELRELRDGDALVSHALDVNRRVQ